MRRCLLTAAVFVSALAFPSGAAAQTPAPGPADPAAPVLDQSFTTPGGLAVLIGDCCSHIAQTFTAGRTGRLAGVNIDVVDSAITGAPPLGVEIRDVVARIPGSTTLAGTVVDAEGSGVPLSRLITFPEAVQIVSGQRYAIVVSYLGSPIGSPHGLWVGAPGGDPYPRGGFFMSQATGGWSDLEELGQDLHFQTYIQEAPTSMDQCKNGGWRNFPGFKNQGDCVSFVATGGKNPPGNSP